MDGNNRWAKQNGLRTKDGHRRGAEACRQLILDCIDLGIPYLSLFAFSSENWLRSKSEVRSLMALFRLMISHDEVADLHRAGTKIRFIGNRTNFSKILQVGMREIEERTSGNEAITVTVAVDYGGQWDIAQAVLECIRQRGKSGEARAISDLGVSEVIDVLTNHLSTSDLPDPDLCIRSAGEQRLSNFLLWQFAYTELYFSDTYWPDFSRKELESALAFYASRSRKFGK